MKVGAGFLGVWGSSTVASHLGKGTARRGRGSRLNSCRQRSGTSWPHAVGRSHRGPASGVAHGDHGSTCSPVLSPVMLEEDVPKPAYGFLGHPQVGHNAVGWRIQGGECAATHRNQHSILCEKENGKSLAGCGVCTW